jgi:hypothetical protein
MDKLETLEQAYEIIIDEIDMFMENLYKEQELIRSVVEQIQAEKGVDLEEEFFESSPIDATLGRIDNLKTVIKTIAFQNHNLNLFTQEELDGDELLQAIVGFDHEVF